MPMQRHPSESPAAGLCRNTVVEARFRDEMGRRIFTAIDGRGMRLREARAASDSEVLKVVAQLYESVDYAKSHDTAPLTIIK